MKCFLLCLSLFVAMLGFSAGPLQAAAPVPAALQDWQGWVLKGQEFLRCPFVATGSFDNERSHRCAWPHTLTLNVDSRGGTFAQRWETYEDSWIVLPGSFQHWPRDVRIDGAAAAVVAREGRPQVRLGAGDHSITGRFEWATRPESLPVATQTALVALTLDGQLVAQPERPRGDLWLGQRRVAAEPQQLQIQVYRLLEDEIPARLVTWLRLQVSGDGREELLSVALPAGFTPLSLEGDLPARLEADGRLRVQLRPGSFDLQLAARGPDVAGVISRPAVSGTWAAEEVWSFKGNDRLRVAAVEGAEGIDPAQANVPAEWRGYPAYRLGSEGRLTIVERSRGLANLDDNQLRLRRDLWLDFNHEGFTAVDNIGGALHRDWRLDMSAPFRLESARSGDDNLLVTKGQASEESGVELRTPQIELTTVSRVAATRGSLPATGWSTRFDNVSGLLHLPPGHRLLGVRGADDAPQSWISGWGLWNLFGVLVVVVFTYWVAGRIPAAIAAAALLLMYQEAPQTIWLWTNLLAAVAIARAAPEGRLRRFAAGYRTLSFAVLGLALLPLLIGQLRMALYPQLDTSNVIAMLQSAPVADMTMPAPPPPMEEKANAGVVTSMVRQRSDRALEEVTVTGSRVPASVVQRYAPGTVLQAGPGVPNWNYRDYEFRWSGPVEAAQTVQFIYIGPLLLGIWRVAGVLLLVAFFIALAMASFGPRMRQIDVLGWRRGATAASLLCVGMLCGAVPDARAEATPDPALLTELKARLTEAPRCVPSCAEIMSASVVASANQLAVELKVSALTQLAVALPYATDRWQFESVTVDGKASVAVGREADGSMWVALAPGVHSVSVAGRLAGADSIQVSFPQTPRVISVTATGWDTAGVVGGRLVSGSLELTRRGGGNGSAAALAASEFPAFVQVTRAFNLDLDWSLDTTVQRIAPQTAAIQLEIPLVPGESVLTPGVEVRGGNRVFVGLARGQDELRWHSALARSETLGLTLPQGVARSEVWTFAVNPQWHASFAGVPAVQPEDVGGDWVYFYYPRPGEQLQVSIARPEAVPGQTLAIDSVRHTSSVGKRSTSNSLVFHYRSTQGGRQTVGLPVAGRVTSVTLDDQVVPLRPDKGALSLSLLPGSHSVAVNWTQAQAVGVATRPDRIDLGSPASNITTQIGLPQDRWPLYVHGGGVGPALLYWGELIVFIGIAWSLGRLAFSPLKGWEWLLLGLGLSTLSWFVFLGMVLWLLAMRWRETWQHAAVQRWPFNIVQLALAGLTFIAVASLVFSGVRYGLLSAPDMSVVGPGSYGTSFQWFADRSEALLPQPLVISLPLWVYKSLMFAWALWIALALARWLRFAWAAWTRDGMWRGKLVVPAKAG